MADVSDALPVLTEVLMKSDMLFGLISMTRRIGVNNCKWLFWDCMDYGFRCARPSVRQ